MTTKRKTTTARTSTKPRRSASKTTVKKATAPKETTNVTPVKPVKPVISESTPTPVTAKPVPDENAALRRGELVDLVAERADVKRRDAKASIEAALEILGETLASGRDLNLQPFGKMRVTREKKMGEHSVLTVRIRQTQSFDASPKDTSDTE